MACAVLGISDPCTATAGAQPSDDSSVVRDILQTTPIEADGPQEAVTGVVVFPPRSSAGHHIHHGVESGYVLSGEVEARAVVTWIVDAGVPLTTPVP